VIQKRIIEIIIVQDLTMVETGKNANFLAAQDVEGLTVLVEWPRQPGGIHKASRGGAATMEALKEKSDEALHLAMQTIRSMSYRVFNTMDTIGTKARPDEAEIEFGINLDTEVGALVAKASTGAQIKVTLKWNKSQISQMPMQTTTNESSSS
jgi:hypothetical protein